MDNWNHFKIIQKITEQNKRKARQQGTTKTATVGTPNIILFCFVFLGATALLKRWFRDHTRTHTIGRTPLDE